MRLRITPSWSINVSVLCLSFTLLGCSPLQPYIEPDPTKEPTARMRTMVWPNSAATFSLHVNSNNNCLIYAGGMELPRERGNFDFFKKYRKIGIPPTDANVEKYGTEFYIPAKNDLTIAVDAQSNSTFLGTSCFMAFRFKPIAGKDYQLFAMVIPAHVPGNPGEKLCIPAIKEVYIDNESKKALTRDVPHSTVIVPWTPAWNTTCVRN